MAVIDDDEAPRCSLADLMRSLGHGAEPFTSAEAFLSSPDLSRFDCVIADIHLPGVNGFDLLRKLQEQDRMIPVILMTALTDTQLDEQAISAGAHGLLRKPFETKALLECIERSFLTR